MFGLGFGLFLLGAAVFILWDVSFDGDNNPASGPAGAASGDAEDTGNKRPRRLERHGRKRKTRPRVTRNLPKSGRPDAPIQDMKSPPTTEAMAVVDTHQGGILLSESQPSDYRSCDSQAKPPSPPHDQTSSANPTEGPAICSTSQHLKREQPSTSSSSSPQASSALGPTLSTLLVVPVPGGKPRLQQNRIMDDTNAGKVVLPSEPCDQRYSFGNSHLESPLSQARNVSSPEDKPSTLPTTQPQGYTLERFGAGSRLPSPSSSLDVSETPSNPAESWHEDTASIPPALLAQEGPEIMPEAVSSLSPPQLELKSDTGSDGCVDDSWPQQPTAVYGTVHGENERPADHSNSYPAFSGFLQDQDQQIELSPLPPPPQNLETDPSPSPPGVDVPSAATSADDLGGSAISLSKSTSSVQKAIGRELVDADDGDVADRASIPNSPPLSQESCQPPRRLSSIASEFGSQNAVAALNINPSNSNHYDGRLNAPSRDTLASDWSATSKRSFVGGIKGVFKKKSKDADSKQPGLRSSPSIDSLASARSAASSTASKRSKLGKVVDPRQWFNHRNGGAMDLAGTNTGAQREDVVEQALESRVSSFPEGYNFPQAFLSASPPINMTSQQQQQRPQSSPKVVADTGNPSSLWRRKFKK